MSKKELDLDEAINIAMTHTLKRCGTCYKWMTKQCPKEKGVMNGGPTARDVACDSFENRYKA